MLLIHVILSARRPELVYDVHWMVSPNRDLSSICVSLRASSACVRPVQVLPAGPSLHVLPAWPLSRFMHEDLVSLCRCGRLRNCTVLYSLLHTPSSTAARNTTTHITATGHQSAPTSKRVVLPTGIHSPASSPSRACSAKKGMCWRRCRQPSSSWFMRPQPLKTSCKSSRTHQQGSSCATCMRVCDSGNSQYTSLRGGKCARKDG